MEAQCDGARRRSRHRQSRAPPRATGPRSSAVLAITRDEQRSHSSCGTELAPVPLTEGIQRDTEGGLARAETTAPARPSARRPTLLKRHDPEHRAAVGDDKQHSNTKHRKEEFEIGARRRRVWRCHGLEPAGESCRVRWQVRRAAAVCNNLAVTGKHPPPPVSYEGARPKWRRYHLR
jgi:hypothetical protein